MNITVQPIKRRRLEQFPGYSISSDSLFRDLNIIDSHMEMLKATLGLAIRNVVERKGLSTTDLAERGLNEQQYSDIRKAHYQNITHDQLFEILEHLGQDVFIGVATTDSLEPQGFTSIQRGDLVLDGD